MSVDIPQSPFGMPGTRVEAAVCLALFTALLFALPVFAELTHIYSIDLVSSFYRVGSLVFGAGHVVLPLLQVVVVPREWGIRQRVSRWLWSSAGDSGAAIYVCGVPGCHQQR
jgi:chromate transporter